MNELPSNRWPNAGRRIAIEPTGVITSPSFRAEPPRIRNSELIEPGCKAIMEEYWRRGRFEGHNLEFFRIQDVFVVDECLILDSELQVITSASDIYGDEEVARAIEDIRRGEAAKTISHFDRPTIVAKRRAACDYDRFLCEILPMAVIGTQILQHQESQFLLHRAPSQMQDVMFRSLRLLGVCLDHVLVQDFREPMFFKELLIVRKLVHPTASMSPLCMMATDKMAGTIFDNLTSMPGRRHERIFVRSAPESRGGQPLDNEAEVSERLGTYGYWTIEPGHMSLEQQIALFRGAKHVVGVAGTGMTNIAFCSEGTRITLLLPGSFPSALFWFIATHRRLNYEEIRADLVINGPTNSRQAGFTIRKEDIAYLEETRPRFPAGIF